MGLQRQWNAALRAGGAAERNIGLTPGRSPNAREGEKSQIKRSAPGPDDIMPRGLTIISSLAMHNPL